MMAIGLDSDAEGNVSLRTEAESPLANNHIRVRTELAAIKHGTEFHIFSKTTPFETEWFDGGMRLFVPKPEHDRQIPFSRTYLGNMVVGTVLEMGTAVTQLHLGDRVYGYAPAMDVVTMAVKDAHPLGTLKPMDALCLDPALYAYAAVRDARACLGDHVAVFGLGAIGLLIVQMLKKAGCLQIVAVDPIENRRALAEKFGATLTFDPMTSDIGMELRRLLGNGADIAIEASGNYHALQAALRSVRQCGRVVTLGFFHGQGTALELSKEWLHNRLELISSMPTWGNPPRDYPLWTEDRLVQTVAELFHQGFLHSEEIIDPIVAFADSPQAFLNAYHSPAQFIKLGIRFP